MHPDPLNTLFQKAVSFVNHTNKHLFLTGKAGTGKTTFLKYIKENTFKKLAVVAPTGVAAINARGVTVHSFFQLPLGPYIPSEKPWHGAYNGEANNKYSLLAGLRLPASKRQVIQELDLLIIDEISMVRADLLDAIDAVMRHFRKQPLLPFGGVQMVYIGDLFQLPPVVRNEEWDLLQEYYKSPFFFDAHVIAHVPPVFIQLKKIYRQKDDVFINILNNIRNNRCPEKDLDILHQRFHTDFVPPKGENYITLCSHNYKADAINRQELEKLTGRLYRYSAKITGEFYERSYPTEKELQLKHGAQIMFIKNDKGEVRRYYNGKIGTVSRIEPEKIFVTFPGEHQELELEQEKWQNLSYTYSSGDDKLKEEELGTFTQYPIKLAWAITIHKSQGLTFEKAIVDAGASFAAGQVYVSLSRLTSIEGLVLKSRILPNSISTHQRVIEFEQQQRGEDELQQTLEKEQKSFITLSVLKSFEWEKVHDAVAANAENTEARQIPDKDKAVKLAAELLKAATSQKEVAGKFEKQLETLFLTAQDDGYKKLYERTQAGAKYFLDDLDNKLYMPLKKHIEGVKIKKKVKRYIKELQELLLALDRKKQQLRQAVPLAEGLKNSKQVDELLQMMEASAGPTSAVPELLQAIKAKPQKGESSSLTLQMFKQGKSIADICAQRGLATGTVESHLAEFITTGEVDILELVDHATVEKLIPIVAALPEAKLSVIKEKAGEKVSYFQIGAVRNYLEWVKKNA